MCTKHNKVRKDLNMIRLSHHYNNYYNRKPKQITENYENVKKLLENAKNEPNLIDNETTNKPANNTVADQDEIDALKKEYEKQKKLYEQIKPTKNTSTSKEDFINSLRNNATDTSFLG